MGQSNYSSNSLETNNKEVSEENLTYTSLDEEIGQLNQQDSVKTNYCCCFPYKNTTKHILETKENSKYQKWNKNAKHLLRFKYKHFKWSKQMSMFLNDRISKNVEFEQNVQQKFINEVIAIAQNTSSYSSLIKQQFSIQFKFKNQHREKELHSNLIQEEEKQNASNNEQSSFQMTKDEQNQLILIIVRFIFYNSQSRDNYTQKANSLAEDGRMIKQKQVSLNLYKTVMSQIEEHLRESQNPLNVLFQTFLIHYRDQYIRRRKVSLSEDSKIEQLITFRFSGNQEKKCTKLQKLVCEIIDDIKGFTDFFIVTLFAYYDLSELFEKSVLECFNVENLSSFVITLLFRNDELFNHLISSLSHLYKEDTQAYFNNVLNFYDEKPSFFGVPMHLELLQETIEKIQQIEKPDSFDEENNSYLNKINLTFRQQSDTDTETPYHLAIRSLQKLYDLRSPVHQLKLISKTTDLIQQSINQFYQTHNLRLIKNFGADELVPIMIYVVVKSRVKDLGIYLKLIESFTPKNALNSSCGYKLVTLNWEQKQVEKKKLSSQSLIFRLDHLSVHQKSNSFSS